MGHVEAAHISHTLPDGRVLLDDVSFRIGDGTKAALIGPNGAGKTTLLRLIAGDSAAQEGTVTSSGGLGVMRQFVGGLAGAGVPALVPAGLAGLPERTPPARPVSPPVSSLGDESTVHDLLVSVAPRRIQEAAARLDAAELAMMERDDEPTQLRYAAALTEWGDAGGYEAEVHWDACCTAALGIPYERCRWREMRTLSGGERKRLVLESLLRGKAEVLLLDEPDNYLDVPGKLWLEQQLAATPKTVLLVSHDRELLANCAERIITVEDANVWVHGGGFASYAQARRDRIDRLDELRRRWDEEHEKIKQLVRMYRQKAAYNSDMASRLQAAVTRLRKFEEEGPPELAPREQNVRMRLRGGRTGKRAVICENLELSGLMKRLRPGGLVRRAGRRARLQRLREVTFPAACWPATRWRTPDWPRLGARVVPGMFAQTHFRPDLDGRSPREIVMTEHAMFVNEAMSALARYELQSCAGQPFGTLSGGQQARLQILLLELAGSTLLLLDEPTDNLDLASAEALQEGLESYAGTVLAVTHDRWFARSFDRFLVFGAAGDVYEADGPVWDETRVARPR